MLKTANLSENLLISVDVAEKDEMVDGGGTELMNKNLSKSQKLKIPNVLFNVGANANVTWFWTSKASAIFIKLRQAFTKALLLWYFDPEYYIRIKIDALGYAIGGRLSQLILDFGQWYPVAYFLRKMILAKTRYETHEIELLAIIEAFKTWRHHLEGCKYEVFVFTNHNNLGQFIDIKNLSFRQVW